jgi:mannitol-1-phosphate 5-dehydrogenase
MKFDALLGSIEKALQFQNVEGDDESKELAKILKEKSAAEAIQQLTGLETDHPLYQPVLKVVEKVQSESK